MSDPFAAYAKQAQTIVTQPARLVGPIKTRNEARLRYAQIVDELNCCHTPGEVDAYVASIASDLRQYAAELEFLWSGDDVFRGLEREIEWARARVDDGLDFPRWEVRGPDDQAGATS